MKDPKEPIAKTTIRMPESLWHKVRILAVKENCSAESIVIAALKNYLKGEGR